MKKGHLLVLFAFILSITLIGCAGSDGKNGANGIDGSTGLTGPVTNTEETCAVCHSSGKTAGADVVHQALTKPTVSNIIVTSVAGTGDTIQFTVKVGTSALTGLLYSNFSLYISDIVPSGTAVNVSTFTNTTNPVGTWSTSYLERWYNTSTSATNMVETSTAGTYKFTMTDKDLTTGNTSSTGAPDFNNTHKQRLLIRVDARNAVNANYTPRYLNRTIGLIDFTIPADGATATATGVTRAIVDAKACTNCHGDPLEGAAHGGGYQDVNACNICHSPIAFFATGGGRIPSISGDWMQYNQFWTASMIHRIHSAQNFTGADFSEVELPQDVKNCSVCHFDNGQDMVNAWKTNPTREVCATCHTTIKFDGSAYTGLAGTAGTTHTYADNTQCTLCHPATGGTAGIVDKHVVTAATKDTPEFDVTITTTGATGAGFFQAGDVPVVTVTLNVHGGAAANPLFYTTAAGAKGVTSDTALSAATLRVYGPRAKAVPVLTPGSTTDAAYVAGTVPTQGVKLLTAVTGVANDATGFHMTLQAIPATLASGTYMISFEGADYGGVSATDYVTSSTGLITIQIGTATVENKVAGDGCFSCHGDTRMHLQGSHAHNIAFDTDACLGCHDQSGNHGNPISNRVHAIHSNNTTGDLMNYTDGVLNATADLMDWSLVTYPQGNKGKTCVACHESGNTSYISNPTALACSGCHMGADNVTGTAEVEDHMKQNGAFPSVD